MTTTKCRKQNYHPYIDAYIDGCRNGTIIVDNEILLACDLIENKLCNPDVLIDAEKTNKAVELIERYFKIELFDWELLVIALIHCYYKSSDTVVFDEFFIMMGRGNGKNGFISALVWYLTTQYHGVKGYNVDIIANSEEQAETSFNDVYEMLEDTWSKSVKFFKKTKEIIINLITRSYIKYNSSNGKTKDGKRSACLVFDEYHEYEDYALINVFKSGFGKRKHSRTFIITTNGHVRDGALDDKLNIATDVLNGVITELGLLPLIYKVKEKEDANDKRNWYKSNPSLKYLPVLQQQIEKEFIEMQYNKTVAVDFYVKRMNIPASDSAIAVVDWDFIIKTNKTIPELRGKKCVIGIDYTKINDLMSVNMHFPLGEKKVDINHSWLCLSSADLPRLRVPWQQWANDGLLTLVDDVEINPVLITEYIAYQALSYQIEGIALDNFRYTLLTDALKTIGFDPKEKKNVTLVRPSDIMKVVPVIESYFAKERFIWGDNPLLRWGTNNTKLIPAGRKAGTDTGNFYYGKIEAKSRKTDPFMALVASVVIEGKIEENKKFVRIPVIT